MSSWLSRETFENSTNISLSVVQCGVADREGDGHFEWNFKILVRPYKSAAHLQKTCAISALLTDSSVDITLISFSSTQIHAPSTGWHKRFEVGKPQIQILHWNSITLYYIATLYIYPSYYVTTTLILTLAGLWVINRTAIWWRVWA